MRTLRFPRVVEIPWQQLQALTLRSLITEYVTRDGTDYGETEVDQETKIEQVHQLLRTGKVKVVFDAESETCDLREVIR